MKRVRAFGLKVAISLLLLVPLLRAVDLGRLGRDLAGLDLGRLALLVGVCWIGQFLCADRWRRFAAALDMHVRYRSAAALYFIGMLFNIGLPSLVGGDVVKAYLVSRRTGAPFGRGIASVLQDRAAGLVSLVCYGTLAAAVYPLAWRGLPVGLVYAAVWVGIAGVLALVWKGERLYALWLHGHGKGFVQNGIARAASFHRALATMRLGRGGAAAVVVLSFLNSAIVLWMFQQVTVAAGHPIDLVAFTALLPLMTLVTMAPVTLGGLGIREWTYVEALGLLGVPPQTALAIALSTSALLVVINLPGAVLLPSVSAELPWRTADSGRGVPKEPG